MPHHNRAILADIGIQKLDPTKEYKKTSKNGLLQSHETKEEEAKFEKKEQQVEIAVKNVEEPSKLIEQHENEEKISNVVDELKKDLEDKKKQFKPKANSTKLKVKTTPESNS